MVSRLQGEGIFSHYLEDVRAARLNIKPSKNRNYSSCFVWGFIFFALNSWLTFTGVKLGCCCRGGGTKKLRAAPPYQALLASWPERGWGTERQVINLFFLILRTQSMWMLMQEKRRVLLLPLGPLRADWCNWCPREPPAAMCQSWSPAPQPRAAPAQPLGSLQLGKKNVWI